MLNEGISKDIFHPYSDKLIETNPLPCYSIDEVVSEKLRALIQRSYTAPRDFYDLYFLTNEFQKEDWKRVKTLFLLKMEHKNIEYLNPQQLVPENSLLSVKKAWAASIAHQVKLEGQTAEEIILEVVQRILENLK